MTDPIQLARECGFHCDYMFKDTFMAEPKAIATLISRVREEAIRECAEVCNTVYSTYHMNDPKRCAEAVRALLDQSYGAQG